MYRNRYRWCEFYFIHEFGGENEPGVVDDIIVVPDEGQPRGIECNSGIEGFFFVVVGLGYEEDLGRMREYRIPSTALFDEADFFRLHSTVYCDEESSGDGRVGVDILLDVGQVE